MAETFICSHCHMEHRISGRRTFKEKDFCFNCLVELTTICENCGSRIWVADNCGDNDYPLCERCREDYSPCRQCGQLIHHDHLHYLNDDDDEGYCYTCFRSHGPSEAIQGYYYKPEPIFYGSGDRFYGIELEIDEGGELDANARKLMAIANGDGKIRLYCKHDGSLSDGIECISHPATLGYHQTEMPWGEILDTAVKLGYCSHQAGCCGLHVHTNRTAFGVTQEEQDDAIARILFFVENNWNELLRFSRRTKRQMEQWAARYGRKDDPKAVLDHAKNERFDRYTCVNLTNRDTIEFRMFRGTLKLNTFMATLELVDKICEVALSLSDQEMKDLTWTEFVSGCTKPELVQYLKERRLYVNEPVAVSEEV